MMSNRVRFWLVLLLALVLPVKGVMAVSGSLCHVPGAESARSAPHGHPHATQASHDAGPAQAQPGSALHDPQRIAPGAITAADGACLACASVCGAPPLPAGASLAVAGDLPARAWSALAPSTPPSHVPAGLERPPRST